MIACQLCHSRTTNDLIPITRRARVASRNSLLTRKGRELPIIFNGWGLHIVIAYSSSTSPMTTSLTTASSSGGLSFSRLQKLSYTNRLHIKQENIQEVKKSSITGSHVVPHVKEWLVHKWSITKIRSKMQERIIKTTEVHIPLRDLLFKNTVNY